MTPPPPTESRIQQDIWRWYRNNFCLRHHKPRCVILTIPNEGNPKLTTIGSLSGASDLLVLHRTESNPLRVLFVEVKTPTGRQSPKQKDFQSQVDAIGIESGICEYHLVRSLMDFQKILVK